MSLSVYTARAALFLGIPFLWISGFLQRRLTQTQTDRQTDRQTHPPTHPPTYPRRRSAGFVDSSGGSSSRFLLLLQDAGGVGGGRREFGGVEGARTTCASCASASVSIRQHTSAYVRRALHLRLLCVSIRQHTAYSRQHTHTTP
jgi:hypothetical protein